MSDANALIKRAAVQEAGHGLAHFLLSGDGGALEVKWNRPGDGFCYSKWPKHRDDDLPKFYIYSGLTDAAGLAAERLFDKWASPDWSVTDRERVATAAKELFEIGEWRYGTPQLLAGWFENMAKHLLEPHAEAIEGLAGKATSQQRIPDVTRSLFTLYPEYRAHQALFEGDWRAGWVAFLESFEQAHEANVERWQAMHQRLVRCFG